MAMRIEENISINRRPDQVWSFLGDTSNLPTWDRGVAQVIHTKGNPGEVGFEFDTIAPAGVADRHDRGRMSYRVVAAGPDNCTVELTSTTGNARFAKPGAHWYFHSKYVEGTTLLTHGVKFKLRFRYLILLALFYALKGALRGDLQRLKCVIEET